MDCDQNIGMVKKENISSTEFEDMVISMNVGTCTTYRKISGY